MAQAPLIPGVRTEVVTSKFPRPLAAALDRYIERVGANRSSIARLAVEQLLEREAPDLLEPSPPKLVA